MSQDIKTLLEWECDTYGAGVVSAFGEYYALKQRIIRRMPHLASEDGILRSIIRRMPHFASEDGILRSVSNSALKDGVSRRM